MANMIKVNVDGIDVEVEEGTKVIDAAFKAGVKIPTLCYLKGLNEIGACRICLCEVEGARGLVAACVYPLSADPRFPVIHIKTNTPQIREYRKRTIELLLSDHKKECLSCIRNGNCELAELAKEYDADYHAFEGGEVLEYPIDDSSAAIIRDNNKCVLCRRCVAACREYQSVSVIGANGRGFYAHIGSAFEKNLGDTACVNCGQCIVACPTGALHERDQVNDVLKALADPTKYVVVGTAPSVRVGLGEEFGTEIGANVEGKMAAALRRIGFKNVFDVNFTADLTILEEGTEFIGRVTKGGTLPMLTSCSPAWIKFMEHNFPTELDHLSSCKSPQGMFGAICKTYLAEKLGIDPKDMVVVTIMPCTAKKFEKERPQMEKDGMKDVDCVLTTRELAKLIKRSGINFAKLPDEEYDQDIMGAYTGAAVIFGATGGVMEAALRTAYFVLTGKESKPIEFHAVRGMQGLKEADIDINGTVVKVAVASGMRNAKVLLDQIKEGKSPYTFIEIMCCPGGCVNGGGQPYIKKVFMPNEDDDIYETYREKRAQALYSEDERQAIRQSHNNPQIKELYEKFLGEPNSHLAHELLHTTYAGRVRFPEQKHVLK